MIFRKREDPVNLKRKYHIQICGEFLLEEAMELAQGRLRNE